MYLTDFEESALTGLSVERKTEIVYGGLTEYEGTADLALLLGGQPRECEERAKKAARLYLDGRVKYIMPSGGVKWDTPFGNMSEAALLSEYMKREGVPEEAIKLEEMAENTKENMLFAGVQIIRQLRKEPIRRIILVTSTFHMKRSLAIAKSYLPDWYEVYPCMAHTEADFADEWFESEYRSKRVDIEIINLHRDILKGIGENIAVH